MTAPLLVVESLCAGYGRMQVLHEVSLTVGTGQAACIIGPNGAGKSTVLKAVFGSIRIFGGHVRFDGRDITGWAPRELVRAGIAYVPQGQVVFPSLTVAENLELGARAAGLPILPQERERVHQRFPRILERLYQRAGTLSGGEQQMVAIARALLCRPRLLLMDEPSLGLAPQLTTATFAHIRQLREAGTSVLLVEQNARRALAISDQGYVLELGRNRYQGSGEELMHDPKVQDLYLGGAVSSALPATEKERGETT